MAEKDNAFRRMLGDKELFLRFARRYLGRDLSDMGPEDVVLENTTFIPEDLREKRSDVVYRIRRGDLEAYVYILIEHQSRVDFLMPWRMLSYMVKLWETTRLCCSRATSAGISAHTRYARAWIWTPFPRS